MGHEANIVTLSEETESNRENKPASKVTKAHIYSTVWVQDYRVDLGCSMTALMS